jgi:hypothetical protein
MLRIVGMIVTLVIALLVSTSLAPVAAQSCNPAVQSCG